MIEGTWGFWSAWVIGLTGLSLAGLLWLLFSVYFAKNKAAAEGAEPVWDGDLTEGQTAPPMWWFWLLLVLLVFSVLYLMLYPGWGSFPGMLHWSQSKQLAQSTALHDVEFGAVKQVILDTPYAQLRENEQAMSSARALYTTRCSACHGSDARGQANRFPDLRDGRWQWGGTEAEIEQTIRSGRRALMPPWEHVLDEAKRKAVARYVASLSIPLSNTAPSPEEQEGRIVFAQYCGACHGANAKGNPAVGAPDLTDDVWLYGRSEQAIHVSIAQGRAGVMPAQEHRLNNVQIRLLTAWLTRPDTP